MKTYFIFLCLLVSGRFASATTQTAANQDKPCLLYVKYYSESRSAELGGDTENYYSYYSNPTNYDYEYGSEQETINEWIRYNDGQTVNAFCQQNSSYNGYENILENANFRDWTEDGSIVSVLNTPNGHEILNTSVSGWNSTYVDNASPPSNWSTNFAVPPLNITNAGISIPIQWEYCKISTPIVDISYNYAPDGANMKETYNRSAQTQLKLKTGGKATSKLRQLYGLSGIAAYSYPPVYYGPAYVDSNPISDAWGDNWVTSFYPFEYPYGARNRLYGGFDYADYSSVLPQNISIGSYGTANTNGTKYLILPDNADVDVTPYVAGMDYYTFDLNQPQKYHSYFDLFVQQANPGYSLNFHNPTNDVGHAFWRFRTDAPSDAMQNISPSLTIFLGQPWGFYPSDGLFTVPGQLQNDSSHSYNISRTYYIGFSDLINGLEYTRGISNAPPVYVLTAFNCVGAARGAGYAADIFGLPGDESPQNFGVTLIEMYPAPGQIIGPFIDANDVFYSSAPY